MRPECVADLFERAALFHRGHLDPGGQDLHDRQVVEFDSGPDEFALVLVDRAPALDLVHDGQQFLIGHGGILPGWEKPVQQLFPLREQSVERGEQHRQHPQGGGQRQGDRLRILLSQAFG